MVVKSDKIRVIVAETEVMAVRYRKAMHKTY